MLLSVSGAYVLSKPRLPGRNFLLIFVVVPMLFSGGMIPTYLVMKDYGLINSIWSMILPWAVSSYYLIIMKNYFRSISPSLEEAAVIDGAGDLQILIKIILPISLPFTMTFLLFYAVERWNEWWNAYLYINEKRLYPLQIYLREILINMNNQLSLMAQINSGKKIPAQSVQMATIIVTALPILCVYPFVQKYFVKGVMIGSIKE
jgi:putative aldouronate transport system permease protein